MTTPDRRLPWLTIAVTVLTGACFAWQLADPHVLEVLRRDPAGLHPGNLWRVVTPLLIQSDGWVQAVFNLATLALFGTVVERFLGRLVWLVAYLGAGIVGQWIGYSWNPSGGGNSVAVCGLVGVLVVAMVLVPLELPVFAIFLVPYYSVALMGYAVGGVVGQEIGLVATALGIGAIIVLSRVVSARRSAGSQSSRTGPPVVLLGRLLAVVVVAEAVVLLLNRDHHGAALLAGVAIGFAVSVGRTYPAPMSGRS